MIEILKRLGSGDGPTRRIPRAPSVADRGTIDEEIVAAIALALALDAAGATQKSSGETSLWVLAGRIQQLNRARGL